MAAFLLGMASEEHEHGTRERVAMIYGMYLSTMGALAQSHRHATISNNLANTNTNGFKPDWSLFKEVPVENEFHPERSMHWDRILMNTGGGVWNETTFTDFQPGPMDYTGNVFDVALHDEPHSGKVSFFMVRPDAEGSETYYSRDGHFVPDQDGVLRNMSGDLVLDPGGNPINVAAPENSVVSINEYGQIIANLPAGAGNAVLGQLGVMRTADKDLMVKQGENRLVPEGAVMENYQAGIMSGYQEKSATNAIEEMTNMIEASRVYEMNMKFVTIQDEQLGNAVSRIANTRA